MSQRRVTSFHSNSQNFPTTNNEIVDNEFNDFIATTRNNFEPDPVKFWKEHSQQFPLMAEVAKKYLCIPATQISCERVFSSGGNVVSKHRTRMAPKRVDEIVSMKHNLAVLKKLGIGWY